MTQKPKTPQKENPEVSQTRDFFRTPKYAVDLLIPYIPQQIKNIWECASGEGHISKVLIDKGYSVFSSDIIPNQYIHNFILDDFPIFTFEMIITNPPFSLKQKFYKKCLEYSIPFALLIPADYSKWIIDAIRFDGCEKIIPSRRIDYITPSNKKGSSSASQFHSMWLTRGFNLGKSETFVELTNEMKKNVEPNYTIKRWFY